MKQTLLFFVLLLSGLASAQTINIPDANLKYVLLIADEANNIARDNTGNSIVIDSNNNAQIEVNEALMVHELNVSGYNIASIDGIGSFENLKTLNCSSNNLEQLDMSGLSQLIDLNCSTNQITTLNLNGLENLVFINCSHNLLTELDLSGTSVTSLTCNNNSIWYLNLKNGMPHTATSQDEWHDNPLTFICGDENETDTIVQILETNNYSGVNVNTYCSFTPGGDYNTISGTLTFDADNNGCDAGDAVQGFIKVNISDGNQTESVFTNSAGAYTFFTQSGSFTVTPEFENDYYSVSPALATVDFPIVDNSAVTENFCITANGISKDIEVVMVPLVAARPGQDAVYKIVYRNKGNQVLSGSVNCIWEYQYFNNVSLLPSPNMQAPGDYTWYYSNLLPFENREIIMVLGVNPSSGPNAVNVGDVIPFTANATVSGSDAVPQDNTFLLDQEVVGSVIANNIVCIEGETASPEAIGEYLHYVVNFENTGNDTANSVVVTHIINPAYFDINTLQVLNSSHEVTARIVGNTLEFIFDNINLSAMGHGNILFKLKSRNSLQAGNSVMNQANVYFDYNAPVATNEAHTVFGTLSRNDFAIDASVQVYPNPSSSIVTIIADSEVQSVELYDIQGRILQTTIGKEASVKLDVSQRSAGFYFARIRTERGIKVEKIVRE